MSEWIDSSEMSSGMKSGFATGDPEEDVTMHFPNSLRDTGIKGRVSAAVASKNWQSKNEPDPRRQKWRVAIWVRS